MNFKLKSPHSNNESLIIFYSNLKNGQRFVYSTGEKISPKLWDPLNQYPIKTKIRIDLLKCNAVKSQLERYIKTYREYESIAHSLNEPLTKDKIRSYFDQSFKNIRKKSNFYLIFDEFADLNTSLGNWCKSTQVRYRIIKKDLINFDKINGPSTFNSIDMVWYASFKSYCEEIKRHSINTFGRNVGLIKTFLNYALREKRTLNDKFKLFKAKREITNQVVLSKSEVLKLYHFDFTKNTKLEKVRDVFVFGCLTGMRYSDFKRVQRENIENGTITLREIKDKSKTLKIPLVTLSRAILEKYNYKLPIISDQKFRNYIKEACKIVGFTDPVVKSSRIGNNVTNEIFKKYERVSTHTARTSLLHLVIRTTLQKKTDII
ncbi:site-specific integrase [Flavobacteriaceae bacterium]|nr:site-specific integrase [Flavobacteriaceae bacterium]